MRQRTAIILAVIAGLAVVVLLDWLQLRTADKLESIDARLGRVEGQLSRIEGRVIDLQNQVARLDSIWTHEREFNTK